VTADRHHQRDAPVLQQFGEVAHLADARAHVRVPHRFLDTDRHRFHVAARKATAGVQALADDHEVAQFLDQAPVVHDEPRPWCVGTTYS
jgi:hypothetical protein